MTEEQVKEILDRVLGWPPDVQERVARFVLEVEARRGGDDLADEGWKIVEQRAGRRVLAPDEEVDQAFDRYRGIEQSTRLWLIVGSVISCALTTIGWAIAVYAFVKTSGIQQVEIVNPNGASRVFQDKISFLFAPPVFQTFVFFMLLNPTIRWKKFLARAVQIASPRNVWTTPKASGLPFPAICRIMSAGLCVLNCINLYWAVERATYVLSK